MDESQMKNEALKDLGRVAFLWVYVYFFNKFFTSPFTGLFMLIALSYTVQMRIKYIKGENEPQN